MSDSSEENPQTWNDWSSFLGFKNWHGTLELALERQHILCTKTSAAGLSDLPVYMFTRFSNF